MSWEQAGAPPILVDLPVSSFVYSPGRHPSFLLCEGEVAVEVLIAQSCLTSLRPHGLKPARLLCPWDFPDKITEVGCHSVLQGIFLNQGSNPGLLHLLRWRAGSLLPAPRPDPNRGTVGKTPKRLLKVTREIPPKRGPVQQLCFGS